VGVLAYGLAWDCAMSADECMAFAGIVMVSMGFVILYLVSHDND